MTDWMPIALLIVVILLTLASIAGHSAQEIGWF